MLDTEKAGPAEQVQVIEKSVAAILEGAETLLSSGASTTEKTVAYVREMQRADAALARAVALAREAGLEADATRLARKQRTIDNSVAEHITSVANNIGRERDKSMATLNAVFKLGHGPDVAIDGPCRGQLLSSTLFGPLDSFGRFVARFYLPWKGKKFDAAGATGCNIFTRSAPVVGRVFWPLYSAWKRYRPGKFTAFKFNTYTGQGVQDPEVSTLKLDYDNPTNPRLLIRSVLDELVQITSNYYLGKAMLWRPSGRYRLAAFFVLRKQEEAKETKETKSDPFDPDRLAYLEVAGLRAYYDHKWLRAFRLIVDLMHEQFGLSWPRSLEASYYTVRAMLAWAPVDNDPKTMRGYIRKFYKLAAAHGNELRFDAKEAADREYVYWDLHRKRGMNPSSDPEPYIECLAQLHSTLFGMTPQEARESAVLRAHATDAIDTITGKRSTDIEADWRKSEEYLRQAYRSAISK